MDLEDGLLERQDVIAAAADLADRVAAGEAGALFVVGEAGLGKTSVLDRAGRLASRAGLVVGRGRGHPMETGLPLGLAAQALADAGGRGLLGEGEPGLGPGPAGDRAARFYQVLRWLRDRPGKALVLVVDDLHWADADSLALVSFVCRRMGAIGAGLGVVAGLRPWPGGAWEVAGQLAGRAVVRCGG